MHTPQDGIQGHRRSGPWPTGCLHKTISHQEERWGEGARKVQVVCKAAKRAQEDSVTHVLQQEHERTGA
eukprot:1710605-Prorocentrum_lima.AAC.1